MPKSKKTFYKTGVFVGKFFPPHKGHLKAILECSTKCEKLYVVLSHSLEQEQHLCKQNHFNFISPIERLK
jgi:HTH-type transcriptional repressor of NAD biosynthesis genes